MEKKESKKETCIKISKIQKELNHLMQMNNSKIVQEALKAPLVSKKNGANRKINKLKCGIAKKDKK